MFNVAKSDRPFTVFFLFPAHNSIGKSKEAHTGWLLTQIFLSHLKFDGELLPGLVLLQVPVLRHQVDTEQNTKSAQNQLSSVPADRCCFQMLLCALSSCAL